MVLLLLGLPPSALSLNPVTPAADILLVRAITRARALCAAAVALVVALAASAPATATDLDTLRARAQKVAEEVSGLEHDLAGLRRKEARLNEQIDAANRDIGSLELQIHDAEAAYAVALDRYVDRAVEAYKTGSTTQLAMLLSARSLSDMFEMAEATGAIATIDEELVSDVDAARTAAEDAQASVDTRKQRLIAAQAEVAVVADDMSETIAERRATLKNVTRQIGALEAEARRQAALAAEPADAFLRLLSPSGPSPAIPDGYAGTGVTFEGVASWYGPGFEGNLTASGDVFDSSLYTAASLDLPLGTWLYVQHNGRGVVVLVNDRGPYIDDRVLDLSRAAAEAIGITGLGWIEAEILLKA